MAHFNYESWGKKTLSLNLPGGFCFDTLKMKISLSSHLTWAHISKNMPIITKEWKEERQRLQQS